MLTELKTKRRWILSILTAVADQNTGPVIARAKVKHSSIRNPASGELAFAARAKTTQRPRSETGR